jgi:hypothetical protein
MTLPPHESRPSREVSWQRYDYPSLLFADKPPRTRLPYGCLPFICPPGRLPESLSGGRRVVSNAEEHRLILRGTELRAFERPESIVARGRESI